MQVELHLKMLALIFLLFATAGAANHEDLPENFTAIPSRVSLHMFPELGYITLYTVNVANATEALDMFKDKCERNETTHFNEAQYASSHLMACIISLVNETTIMQLHSLGVQNIIHTMCNLQVEIEECGKKFLSSITPCLDDVEKESKQVVQNISKAVTDFLCSDNVLPEITRVFSGWECLYKNSATFENCLSHLSLFELLEDVKMVRILPDFTASKEKCSDLKNSTSCLQEALSECPPSFLGGVIQKIIEIVFTEMCSKYIMP